MAPVINMRNFYNNLFNKQFVKKILPVNPTVKQAANLALISTLTKDAFGCVVYTHQSFNNYEIPDSRRHFVTAVDFSNGLCNVFIPMVTGPLLSKNSDKLFNKWFGRHFDDAACSRMHEKLTRNGIKSSLENVQNVVKKHGVSWGKAGFGVITMLVYSQILVKRIVTPTLSTSLADIFKVHFQQLDQKRKDKALGVTKNTAAENDNNKVDSKEDSAGDVTTKKNNHAKSSIYVISPSFSKFDDIILKNRK